MSLWYTVFESEGDKMKKNNERGETFVGYRPSVMVVKKKNKKQDRKKNKQICRDAMKGDKE